ncbi:MAG TPA: hypothetical protein VFN22_13760 [Gemmatimonadales bacterium]|nr:hypothetical protein [Gemmatimonadales bacterium]
MAIKLSSRQQAQLAWLETVPRKYERLVRAVEQLSTNQADDALVRQTQRLLEEMKSQASQLGLGPLGDAYGIMATMLRRSGGHQTKVRGLREMLAGAKINYDGAVRAATQPEAADPDPGSEPATP